MDNKANNSLCLDWDVFFRKNVAQKAKQRRFPSDILYIFNFFLISNIDIVFCRYE